MNHNPRTKVYGFDDEGGTLATDPAMPSKFSLLLGMFLIIGVALGSMATYFSTEHTSTKALHWQMVKLQEAGIRHTRYINYLQHELSKNKVSYKLYGDYVYTANVDNELSVGDDGHFRNN